MVKRKSKKNGFKVAFNDIKKVIRGKKKVKSAELRRRAALQKARKKQRVIITKPKVLQHEGGFIR